MNPNLPGQKRRTLAFRLVMVLLMFSITVVLLEVGSLGVYPLIFKKGLSRAEIQGRLIQPDEQSTADEAEPAVPSFIRNHILHPYLGFVANPGTYVLDWEFSRGGRKTVVNEQGFPGPDPILKRESNAVNVCLMGGSFAMNLFLDSGDTLVDELKRSTGFKGKKINLVCVAMSGWKQPQQLLALTYLLAQGAQYDVVVNLDGFNEVALPFADNSAAGVYPLFPRSWNYYASRARLPDKAMLQLARLARLKREERARRSFFSSPLLRRSNFCLLLFDVLDRKTRSRIAEADRALRRIINRSPRELTPETSGPRREFHDRDGFFAAMADSWARCSGEMDGLCRANGILYLHALQPNQYVPGSKPLSRVEKETAWYEGNDYAYKIAAQQGYPDLVRDGRNLRNSGEHFLDLTLLFKDVAETLYEDNCCHVNKRGNDLIAARIAAEIASLLSPAAPTSPR